MKIHRGIEKGGFGHMDERFELADKLSYKIFIDLNCRGLSHDVDRELSEELTKELGQSLYETLYQDSFRKLPRGMNSE